MHPRKGCILEAAANHSNEEGPLMEPGCLKLCVLKSPMPQWMVCFLQSFLVTLFVRNFKNAPSSKPARKYCAAAASMNQVFSREEIETLYLANILRIKSIFCISTKDYIFCLFLTRSSFVSSGLSDLGIDSIASNSEKCILYLLQYDKTRKKLHTFYLQLYIVPTKLLIW